LLESAGGSSILIEHDLFRKPVPTFRDHALGMTIAEARRALADMFRQSGFDSPELDARLLVGHALGLDHTALATTATRTFDAQEAGAVAILAKRRLAREPVARIVGIKEFWGLPLRITPATLVPRPETETVVEAALTAIDAGGGRTRALQIADLGTGSGAILLALLTELPRAFGIGTDLSDAALTVARENATQLGLSTRAAMVVSDFGTALDGSFDLVVANPPYIATSDIAALSPEVRHDPLRALDGGSDGLAAYRAIAADAQRLLKHTGKLVLELGAGQATAVATLLQDAGLTPGPAHSDLNGIPRALSAGVATMTR
jgi:release factor glutamine methyltransferase